MERAAEEPRIIARYRLRCDADAVEDRAQKIAVEQSVEMPLAGVRDREIMENIVGKVLGNEDARTAVEKLLEQAKADVHKLLDDNRHLVIALRDELLLREELVGDEIVEVLREAEARNELAQPPV